LIYFATGIYIPRSILMNMR